MCIVKNYFKTPTKFKIDISNHIEIKNDNMPLLPLCGTADWVTFVQKYLRPP